MKPIALLLGASEAVNMQTPNAPDFIVEGTPMYLGERESHGGCGDGTKTDINGNCHSNFMAYDDKHGLWRDEGYVQVNGILRTDDDDDEPAEKFDAN